MSIIIMGSEKQREAPFLQLSNSIIRNSELSNQALGILVRLLIFPKDWKFSIRGYQKAYPMSGEQKIRTGLEELKEKGYITIKRKRERRKTKRAGTYNFSLGRSKSPGEKESQ